MHFALCRFCVGQVRAPAVDTEAYIAWRAATDLRGPYRYAIPQTHATCTHAPQHAGTFRHATQLCVRSPCQLRTAETHKASTAWCDRLQISAFQQDQTLLTRATRGLPPVGHLPNSKLQHYSTNRTHDRPNCHTPPVFWWVTPVKHSPHPTITPEPHRTPSVLVPLPTPHRQTG